jgi:hypothetical protein
MATYDQFSVNNYAHSLMSWRAVLAGLFVAFLTYSILFFLGVAVSGVGLRQVIQDGGVRELGWGAGLWVVLSTAISLFVGSYFAGRISNFVSARIGAAQGLVIAGVFFSIMFAEIFVTAGALGMGFSTVAGVTAAKDGGNSYAAEIAESALGDMNFKQDFDQVAKGVASRLLRGDVEGASNYLAYQSGNRAGVDDRIRIVNVRIQEIGKATANTIAGLGWLAFATLLLGAATSSWGGSIGARNNNRKPLDALEVVPRAKAI